MTTPNTQPADKITPAELREYFTMMENRFDELTVEIAELRAALETMREGLTHASQPAPTQTQTETMIATCIIRTRSNGKWYYKLQGGRYTKQGVTIWEEVLKALQIDPEKIEWDAKDTHTFETPHAVRLEMKTITDDAGIEKSTPRKVIGKA